MKIECVKEKLENAIVKAERITGKNLTLPILKCLLIKTEGSSIVVRATNLDVGIEVTVPCKVIEKGTVAIQADILKTFLSNIPDNNKITLQQEDSVLKVTTKSSETTIKTSAYEEFPSIPKIDSGTQLNIPIEDLIIGFKSVWYSASPSGMKPELSSVYVYFDNGNVVFVATDSFRLAEKRVRVKKLEEFEPILIPFRNVSEVIRVFEGDKGSVEVRVTDNQIAFSKDENYITSRVIDGVFPDYKQIIPDELETSAVVLKKDFQNTLKVSNIFSNKFNQITLSTQPSESTLTVTTFNNDVGGNKSTVDAKIDGEDTEVSFNYSYIVDCFSSIFTDSISLSFGKEKPMVIKPIGDTSFLYLVMPMNR